MKRLTLVGIILVLIFVACSPALVTRVANGWRVESKEAGGFVIGSSQDMFQSSSIAPCRYRKVFAGERRALECNSPNVVTVETRGQIDVQTTPEAPIKLMTTPLITHPLSR